MIAATHRDLKALSARGKFRADLFFRLGVFTIRLPAVRDRGDDLGLLVRGPVPRPQPGTGANGSPKLPRTRWIACTSTPGQGNIRELQSVLKQALLQAVGQILLPTFLPTDLPRDLVAENGGGNKRPRAGTTLSEVEREAIQQCLIQTGGNRQQTAERLGISTRTLLRKIREYALKDPLRPPPVNSEETPPPT